MKSNTWIQKSLRYRRLSQDFVCLAFLHHSHQSRKYSNFGSAFKAGLLRGLFWALADISFFYGNLSHYVLSKITNKSEIIRNSVSLTIHFTETVSRGRTYRVSSRLIQYNEKGGCRKSLNKLFFLLWTADIYLETKNLRAWLSTLSSLIGWKLNHNTLRHIY